MATKIWDSTSNNEIIVRSMAKGLERHCVWQNIACLVTNVFEFAWRATSYVRLLAWWLLFSGADVCVAAAILRIHRVQHDSEVTSVHLFQMTDHQPPLCNAGWQFNYWNILLVCLFITAFWLLLLVLDQFFCSQKMLSGWRGNATGKLSTSLPMILFVSTECAVDWTTESLPVHAKKWISSLRESYYRSWLIDWLISYGADWRSLIHLWGLLRLTQILLVISWSAQPPNV